MITMPRRQRPVFKATILPNWTSETIKARSFFTAKIFLLSLKRSTYSDCRSWVDVMIAIFCDFCQFSAQKLAFSQKPMLCCKN
jgi:hypothetical protein